MAFTYAGRAANEVAVRSPLLPLVAPGAERRAKDAARIDKHVQAARWRGREACYLLNRIARLTPIRDALGASLDVMDWRDDGWPRIHRRYQIVAGAIAVHRNRIEYLGTKLAELLAKKPANQQTAISAVWFAALNATPPTRRPGRAGR